MDELQNEKKELMKNKLLHLFFILFIMSFLFLTCYAFFFRTVSIDVTKDAEIVYQGESGSASVSATNGYHNLNQRTQEFLDSITYQVTPYTNLSNGTVITLTARYDKELAAKYHIEVINETREITVEGLAERFMEKEQIDASFLKTIDNSAERYLKKNMDTILQENITSDDQEQWTLKEYTRSYRIFLQAQDRANKDKIVDIYKISVSQKEAETDSVFYYLITYDDINTLRTIKDENVYGERIVDVDSQEALTRVLHQKYLLSYQASYIEAN